MKHVLNMRHGHCNKTFSQHEQQSRKLQCRHGRRHNVNPQAARQEPGQRPGPLIKICGITSPEDALLAVEAGADFIGMIMWQKAKRSVSPQTAREIAAVAHEGGATAVGVFVDESAEIIATACDQAGITVAQLHGDGARSSFPRLAPHLRVVYVLNSQPDGTIHTPLPNTAGTEDADVPLRPIDWLLIDGMQGGSGQAIDWERLQVPSAYVSSWLLAGGLKPDNVAQAVTIARPSAVDVSSGVCGPDGLRKDPAKVRAFVEAVRAAA